MAKTKPLGDTKDGMYQRWDGTAKDMPPDLRVRFEKELSDEFAAINGSMDWVRKLRDKLAGSLSEHVIVIPEGARFPKNRVVWLSDIGSGEVFYYFKPTTEDQAHDVRKAFDLANSIIRHSEKGGDAWPLAAWHCFKLGKTMAQLYARWAFEPSVLSARRVSRSSAKKGAENSRLSPTQWNRVKAYIEKRETGVSVIEACRQASKQLRTGAFRGLRNVRIEIGADALDKRWRKRSR